MGKELKPDLLFLGRSVPIGKFNLISLAILFIAFAITISLRITLGSDAQYSAVPWYYPWFLAVPQLLLLGLVLSFATSGYEGAAYGYEGIRHFFRKPTTQGWVSDSMLTVVLSVGAILLYSFGLYKFDIAYLKPPQVPKDILGDGTFVLVNLFAITIWVPFVEEFFFRGLLLNVWAIYYGEIKSIFLVSLIFMLVHANPGLYIPVFLSSLLISFLFIKTGTIWAPFLSHAVQNLLVVVVAASA